MAAGFKVVHRDRNSGQLESAIAWRNEGPFAVEYPELAWAKPAVGYLFVFVGELEARTFRRDQVFGADLEVWACEYELADLAPEWMADWFATDHVIAYWELILAGQDPGRRLAPFPMLPGTKLATQVRLTRLIFRAEGYRG